MWSPRGVHFLIGFSAVLACISLLSTIWLFHSTAATRLFDSLSTSKELKADRVFATFLTSSSDVELSPSEDNYFIATRMLIYQMLHAHETRLRHPVPFIVFVTNAVSAEKRKRLTRDGATVIELAHLSADWVEPTESRWSDVMTKLRMWEMEQFGIIAFIDADMVLTRPIDDLFHDPAVRECATRNRADSEVVKGPVPEPPSYLLAAITQIEKGHDFPPIHRPHDLPNPYFFNAGLMVFRPDRALFALYEWLLGQPGVFDPGLPEQGLLNYVHQVNGNMLWTKLDPVWQTQYPSRNDIEHGVYMLHDKWWHVTHENETGELFRAWRWRMEGFYEAYDRLH